MGGGNTGAPNTRRHDLYKVCPRLYSLSVCRGYKKLLHSLMKVTNSKTVPLTLELSGSKTGTPHHV